MNVGGKGRQRFVELIDAFGQREIRDGSFGRISIKMVVAMTTRTTMMKMMTRIPRGDAQRGMEKET